MASSCSCSRPWRDKSELQLEELVERARDRLEAIGRAINDVGDSDTELTFELDADAYQVAETIGELEHELWHRSDPLARSTIGS